MEVQSGSTKNKVTLELLSSMSRGSSMSNWRGYGAAISACEKGRRWQRFLELFEEMRSQALPADVITYNAAVSACEKGKQGQRALEFFEECACSDCRQT